MCTGPFLASDDGGGVRLGGACRLCGRNSTLGRKGPWDGRGRGPDALARKAPWAARGPGAERPVTLAGAWAYYVTTSAKEASMMKCGTRTDALNKAPFPQAPDASARAV